MMSFWAAGTSPIDSSTPRSPRATMTASTSSMISDRLTSACARSSLAMTGAKTPTSAIAARQARTSAALRTNESAR